MNDRGHPLIAALLIRDHSKIRALASAGYVDEVTGAYGTPLELATFRADLEAVRILLDAGAKVRPNLLASIATNRSLGENVSFADAVEMVQLLRLYGADIRTRTFSGLSLLHLSAASSSFILRVLIAAGAEVDARCSQRRTPLHTALIARDLPSITALLNAGADVNALCKGGRTTLQLAVRTGQVAVLTALLEAGAVDAVSSDGHTALGLAVSLGHADCVALLREYSGKFKIP